VTAILYHGFYDGSEPMTAGRDRLRRQCEWIRRKFRPVSVQGALHHLASATDSSSRPPLLVTADDGDPSLLEATGVLREFGIPLTVFLVTGWTDRVDEGKPFTLARIASALYWYSGPARVLEPVQGLTLALHPERRLQAMDALLQHPAAYDEEGRSRIASHLASLEGNPKRVCSWSELRDLSGPGVEFGSHSVTHCRMARCSPIHLRFELAESRRAICDELGSCSVFAYPYGTPDVWSPATTEAVSAAGYRAAFLTESGLASARHSPHLLPRLVVPDNAIRGAAFRALVQGGKVPLERLKQLASHLAGRS